MTRNPSLIKLLFDETVSQHQEGLSPAVLEESLLACRIG
jgi:hypothetical protein